MSTIPQTAEGPSTPLRRCVLAQNDIQCSVVALAPGETMRCEDEHWTEEHVLFVIEGGISVQTDDVTVFLNKDAAMHIAPGRHGRIVADPAGWAKLLRVDFQHRTVIEPPVFTVPPHAQALSNR